jgi:hypothetical protein
VLEFEDEASHSRFLSPEDWAAIAIAHVSCGVAISGPECAAHSDQAAPEVSLEARTSNHSVAIVTRGDSDEDGYDLECDTCGHLVVSETLLQAQAIERLHEQFWPCLSIDGKCRDDRRSQDNKHPPRVARDRDQ